MPGEIVFVVAIVVCLFVFFAAACFVFVFYF